MPQRVLELIERAFLATFAERPKRLEFALGLGPDRRDRDDLLVQPCRAGSIDRKPSHQHQPRLRTRPFDYRDARQPCLEALRQEAREQPTHQTVLEVDLHNFRRVAAVRQAWGFKRNGSDRHALTPFADPLAALARTLPQIVECVLPAGFLGKCWVVGIKPEGSGIADSFRSFAIEIDTGSRQGSAYHTLEVTRAHSDPLARALKCVTQLLLLLNDARISCPLLVIHLGTCTGQPLRVGFLLDCLRERGRRTTIDAALCEAISNPLLDHLPRGAELPLNHFAFAHQGLEHDVGLALIVKEVTAEHLLGRLELAIDAAVTLLKTGRVPGQIEMDEVRAIGLKIDTFARGVGADEDAEQLLRRISIECRLYLFAAILAGCAGEYSDAVVDLISFSQSFQQPPLQPAPGIFPFGEDDEPTIVPSRASQQILSLSTVPANAPARRA